ncbi:MAG: hypothetical protein R3D03_04485 [Geminicoccaceae bacterium]
MQPTRSPWHCARLLPVIPQSYEDIPGNEATPAQMSLGNQLYHDPRLSGSHALQLRLLAHNIGLGGGDGASTSIGHHWQEGAAMPRPY